MCNLTGFVICDDLPAPTASSLADLFMKTNILCVSICGLIVVDNDSKFKGLFMICAPFLKSVHPPPPLHFRLVPILSDSIRLWSQYFRLIPILFGSFRFYPSLVSALSNQNTDLLILSVFSYSTPLIWTLILRSFPCTQRTFDPSTSVMHRA